MTESFVLYLIRANKGRWLLFCPADIAHEWEQRSQDQVQKFIEWLSRRRNRLAAWFGRQLGAAREYHRKLEDRIDPMERTLRAMSGARRFVLHHGSGLEASAVLPHLRALGRRQRYKHLLWLMGDLVAIAATFPLTPLPGPNFVMYYPMLRCLGHYFAAKGAGLAVASAGFELRPTNGLERLEEQLQVSPLNRSAIRDAADRLDISGLGLFLEKMT